MIGEKAYRNALRRRAELRQELEEIETFLRLYEKYARLSGTVEAKSDLKGDLTEERADNPAPVSEDPLDQIAGMGLVPHIRRAILEIGRPQSRGGVVKALSDRGIRVSGQDPATNVGTIMWRAKREFVNLKPHGYWPRDMAYAAAGYDPANAASQDEDDRDDSDGEPAKPADQTSVRNGAAPDLWGS